MSGLVMAGIVMWLGEKLIDLLNWLATTMAVSVGTSPNVTVFPQVQGLASKSMLVVNACYILAIMTAGLVTMFSGSMQARYEVKDLLPRLVFGFVAANYATPLCAVVIEVANALTAAMVGGNDTATSQAALMLIAHLRAAIADPATWLLAVILGASIVFLLFALVFSFVVRVAVLVILAGVAPAAMACYGTPWTQPAAALWWRTLLACLGTATLQSISFSTGINMIIDPQLNLIVLLRLPGSDIGNLMLALVVLWMTVKIPSLIRRYVTRGGGNTNVLGLIMRTVAVQSTARRLPFMRGA